jgi:hypothetical protein
MPSKAKPSHGVSGMMVKNILYFTFTFDIAHSSFGEVHKLMWDA